MRLSNYTLTPTRINNAKAKARLYKLSDGGGLFVEVSTTGQKTWRYQYRFAGSRRDVKIGRYPEIGVADARARHFELRSLLERGVDPAEVRRQETAERRQQAKDSQPAADQFEAFSRRWIRERLMTRSETYRNQIESRLERFVWPAIGEKPLGGVRPADVLAIIEDLRGTPKTAEGVRQHIQQIYNYAIQKLLVEVNPALPLRGVIEVPAAEHHRHLTEPELGAFWRSVAKQGAHFVTIAATRMLMYTMCRKSEVLRARWREFDLERAQWDIPAERMKMKAPHRVYLSRQALEILGLLKAFGSEPQLHDLAAHLLVGLRTLRRVPPAVSCQAYQRTGTPLTDRGLLQHLAHRLPLGRWAQRFTPKATFSASLSSTASASSFLSLAFSPSSSRSRLASLASMPPNSSATCRTWPY